MVGFTSTEARGWELAHSLREVTNLFLTKMGTGQVIH